MTFKPVVLFMALLAIFVAAAASAADLYVCKQSNGVKSYQDSPCAQSDKQVSHDTYTPHVYAAPAPAAPVDETSQQRSYAVQQPAEPTPAQHPTCAGIGCSAYQSGQVTTRQCVAPDGRRYYTTGECRTRVNVVGDSPRDWHHDTVQGVPDAVMVAPDLALDPTSGRYIQLQHSQLEQPVYQRVQDPGRRIDPDTACQLARLDARAHPHDSAAAARAHDVCSKGRGLWDQAPPDRGSR